MKVRIVQKHEVMGMLENENLFVLKVAKRNTGKYISSKLAAALTLREVMDYIKNPNVAFVLIEGGQE